MAKITFQKYINVILQQVHPDMRISSDAKSQINYFLNIIAVEIIKQANYIKSKQMYNSLSRATDKGILSPRIIQTSLRYIIGNNEITKHAISEGTKAVIKYTNYYKPSKSKKRIRDSQKAGLVFSTSKVRQIIKHNTKFKISDTTAIYLTAVLEYIAAELLEISGNSAIKNKRKTIIPRDVFLITENDNEFKSLKNKLDWEILGGGYFSD
jgi:histone H3/H4